MKLCWLYVDKGYYAVIQDTPKGTLLKGIYLVPIAIGATARELGMRLTEWMVENGIQLVINEKCPGTIIAKPMGEKACIDRYCRSLSPKEIKEFRQAFKEFPST